MVRMLSDMWTNPSCPITGLIANQDVEHVFELTWVIFMLSRVSTDIYGQPT